MTQIPPTLHGDETGLLKVVEYNDEGIGKATATFGKQGRDLSIDKLCVLAEHQVAIATRHGELFTWDGVNLNSVAKAVGGQRIKGLCGSTDRLIACGQAGDIEVRTWPTGELSASFQVDNSLESASLCPLDGKRLAVGGKQHDLRIWDVETRQTVFRAKNLPHDSLGMPVPVWITDLCWNRSGMVMTSTAYNDIRAYDLRQKRPVKDISLKEKYDEHNRHLNCMVATPEDNTVIVADNFGQVSIVDILNTGRRISCFRGPKGSVRSLSIDPETRSLACGGLDRYVRIFNLDNHRQIGRFYAKQQVNAVAFGAIPFERNTKQGDDDDESDLDWGDPIDSDENEEESREDENEADHALGDDAGSDGEEEAIPHRSSMKKPRRS